MLIELSSMVLLHYELRGSLISKLLAFEELSYVALSYWTLIELSYMTLDKLSYVALSKPSFLAPLDSELYGSLIFELLAFEELSYVALSY